MRVVPRKGCLSSQLIGMKGFFVFFFGGTQCLRDGSVPCLHALQLLVFCTGDSALSGNGQALPILMYHDVVEDGQPYNTWTVTAGRFRQDLQWLKDHGYACVLPRELARGHLPRGKAVLITFDDGYESNYRLAFPILKEFGDKAAIALVTKSVDQGEPGFLTWDMCREMEASGLVEFGSHTPMICTTTSPVASGVRRARPGRPMTSECSLTWSPVWI